MLTVLISTLSLYVILIVLYPEVCISFSFFQAEDGIRDIGVTGVQTCALPICGGGTGLGNACHGLSSKKGILRAGDRLEPDDGLAELLFKRLAFRVGEGGLAGLADRLCLLARVRGWRVLHQGVQQREEAALAAAVGFTVALYQAGAQRDLEREGGIALRSVRDQAEPALDQPLLLLVPVAARAPGLQPGERPHQQEAEHARGLDVHADVVGVEL